MDLIYSFDKSRFRLGRLCKHGHAWPGTTQSLRRISATASNCMGCTGRKQSNWLISFLDYDAMGWPKSQTLGKLCPSKHDWNELGASLRKHGQCVECAKLKSAERSRLISRKTTRRWDPDLRGLPTAERKKLYKRKVAERLRLQGLTWRGTLPVNTPPRTKLQRAICAAGRCPSVARLVMDEQLRHWREHPKDRAAHERQWAQASWWLQYQINPDLRLYHREKSKRRKAQARGQTPVQIPVAALRQRFNEFGNCCAYCCGSGEMQIEHVIPISRGGPHDIGNIVPACSRCNTSKRDHSMEQWYREQLFFNEIRLQLIRRVMRMPQGQQLALALA